MVVPASLIFDLHVLHIVALCFLLAKVIIFGIVSTNEVPIIDMLFLLLSRAPYWLSEWLTRNLANEDE